MKEEGEMKKKWVLHRITNYVPSLLTSNWSWQKCERNPENLQHVPNMKLRFSVTPKPSNPPKISKRTNHSMETELVACICCMVACNPQNSKAASLLGFFVTPVALAIHLIEFNLSYASPFYMHYYDSHIDN